MWVNGLGARPEMSIKAGYISRDMRISGRIVRVRSTEQSVGIIVEDFCPNIEMNLTVGGTQKWKRNMM